MKKTSPVSVCFFTAAGYGTRFLPVTKAMPKEMLPILTKPLIQYGVEEAKNGNVIAYKFRGNIDGYVQATIELYQQGAS